MAIIKCSECGRAVSDKAAACIGCGAPLESPSAFNLVPKPSTAPPLTPNQLRWRLALASLTLVLGIIAADAVGHRPGSGRWAATLAALLVVVGLCWFIVAILQSVQSRK
jgi:Na+-transporting NADH:ubiquinone oxidoreductase subunit NqrB